MYRLIGLVLLLVACSTVPKTITVGRYRASDAPIYSIAALDTARLVGTWQQVAGFGPKGKCSSGQVDIAKTAAGLAVAYQLCLSGVGATGSGAMQPDGRGRFVVPGQPGPWWVLWADTDYRTLIIGTPSGQFGFILNRGGVFSADRIAAAREILDFNGYDLRQLQLGR